jgi:signal transduction histidine kinase
MIERSSHRKGDEKTAHYATRISLQIKQLTMMINEMLDITKIETGRFTYQPERFVLADLVKELIADQQVTTTTHKIKLAGQSKSLIFADKYRIGQVITNLLSNAIKYSPLAVSVEVKLKESGKWVEVQVKDNGAGISQADQRKLFQPFFRAKNTQSAKGTGIGLFISSQIVNAHNGYLLVRSTLGKGSTFIVKLPKA